MNFRNSLWFLLFVAFVLPGCSGTMLLRRSMTPAQLAELKKHEIIKVHTKSGGLYVLGRYTIDTSGDTIKGYGSFYDFNRRQIFRKLTVKPDGTPDSLNYTIPKSEITLIETNKVTNGFGNMSSVTIVGIPFGIMTAYCLANPKACFGSCPTFYADRGGKPSLMAEGFSSSIAPAFEKRDIDMLYWADEVRDTLSLLLTNEALETHVIRYTDILAFPRSADEKVFASQDNRFYRTTDIKTPLSCLADEGSCLDLVESMDRSERYSDADPGNLGSKEDIILTFNNDERFDLGLLIGSRQTLMTTHLFYQTMAYTGSFYGKMIASEENGNIQFRKRIQKSWDLLGGIEILVLNKNNRWEKIDEINEMGPIAPDVHLVKLPASKGKIITLKLRMTKGLWRIDYLALAKIVGEETPVRIQPAVVLKDDMPDRQAIERLNGGREPLVTFPGDKYKLKYALPSDCSYQFFLDTKGYYLEWMREEWLAEENLKKAAIALYFPRLFLKKIAPAYKLAEPKMEKIFWESRYVK